MADPEQIYQEVLAEEQAKGVTPAVAEGRAKSARARAEHGSPHPKEPRWWPGAQPHLEGGDGGGAAADEEPAAEAVEEPAAAPAEEATADVQADEVEPDAPEVAPAPATEEPVAPAAAGAPAPAPQSVPQEPAAAVGQPVSPAPQPAAAQPAAAAQQAVVPRTTGVSHGTTTGTRLRPEDEVSTEAQFEGQKAMYERRKLIDELVATGVPQVTAYDTDRPRTPWVAILYLLIPLVAIFVLANNDDAETEPAAETVATTPADGGGEGGVTTELVAADIEWDTDTLNFKAGEPIQLTVDNQDSAVHNMSIYPDEAAAEAQADAIFEGPDVAAGASEEYEIDPLEKGTYAFICDYHINMKGEVNVQ